MKYPACLGAVVLVASALGLSCTPSPAEDGSGGMGGEPDEGSGGDGSGGDESSSGGQGGEPSALFSITEATLTLEACTVVMLGEDAWIEIEEGGALVTQGEILEDEEGEQVTRPVAFGPEEEGVQLWQPLHQRRPRHLQLAA